MTTNVLFAAPPKDWDRFAEPLRTAFAGEGLDVRLATEMPAEEVDYVVYAATSGLTDFAPFTRAKAVLSLWAGVEQVVGNASLTQPLCRMVDPGMTEGMVEWVVGHTLRHHLGMDAHIVNPERAWDPAPPPLARERKVAMLGLGALGGACATALAALNFRVAGW
ncbi:MAG: glyoxylate/hydroxypyruvate reductase A, partial [Shimia sp.]